MCAMLTCFHFPPSFPTFPRFSPLLLISHFPFLFVFLPSFALFLSPFNSISLLVISFTLQNCLKQSGDIFRTSFYVVMVNKLDRQIYTNKCDLVLHLRKKLSKSPHDFNKFTVKSHTEVKQQWTYSIFRWVTTLAIAGTIIFTQPLCSDRIWHKVNF